ncbi:MAG: sugar transferase [Chloroflexota bacterium]|nr:sugar transferase [Anaerolineae bacterium]
MAAKITHLRQATYTPRVRIWQNESLYLFTKRLLDMVLATIALVLLTPLMAIIAIAIRLDTTGPILFRQGRVRGDQDSQAKRPEENIFSFLKFRSMYHGVDQNVHRRYMESLINGKVKANGSGSRYKLLSDRRITRVGRILRKTSLDELPQLINVLRGEMSLVGPRPAIPYEVAQYQPWHTQRLAVAPGITGLWQTSGRSDLAFDEMASLDIQYADTRSAWLDLAILLRTIPAVLSAKGAE